MTCLRLLGQCTWVFVYARMVHLSCAVVCAVCCRRAKRLKKLNRMLTCRAAQTAADQFKNRAYVLAASMLLVHVLCFCVLYTEINARYQ
jgi:predicted GNAT family N-acyltransferase